jgi:hypothetical protein
MRETLERSGSSSSTTLLEREVPARSVFSIAIPLATGCKAGSGYCVGHAPQGDTYYWTAWLPNASGLPATTGLPVVGAVNDFALPGHCSGNIAVSQLDTFNWAAPNPDCPTEKR